MPTAKSRLDQLLSRCGYCSRREVRSWIRAGRIQVAGAPAESAEIRVLASDVTVDGAPMEAPEGMLVLLHKPAGVVCSHDTQEGPNIYDLLPERWKRRNPGINSIGRLDRDTTGVLLITDLGELVQRWTSPRNKVTKVYEVTIDGAMQPGWTSLFGSGTLVLPDEDTPCAPAHLEIVSEHFARLELTEGRYHQVKRMFAAMGVTVTRLHRSRFGDFSLEGLGPGQWRSLVVPTK